MSIWNKILVGLIGFASIFFFYMAARTLKSHQYWRSLAIQFEQKIEAVQKENRELVESEKLESGKMGLRHAQAELDRVLIQRGRVWSNCEPRKPNAETGAVAVSTDVPVPNGMTDRMVVYVFEEADPQKGGRYIGEFRATAVAEKEVALEPTTRLTDRELKRVTKSKGPWMVYEIMPTDRHELFADLSDEDKKAMLPADSLAEYLKDGKPADPSDPDECKVEGKYERRLRDYRGLFQMYNTERTLFVDLYESMSRDKQYVAEATADANEQLQFAQKAVQSLRDDLGVAQKELTSVTNLRNTLERRLTGLSAIVKQLLENNSLMAAQIAKLQLEAATRIESRARAMAKLGTGAN